MVFDWREYFNLAQFLQGQSGISYTQEAAFQCAVSRAYYAAFCHARNYAHDQHGFSPRSTSEDHQRVRNHFRGRGMVEISRKLENLRQWRNSCDYNDIVPNVPHILTSAIAQSQEILNRLI